MAGYTITLEKGLTVGEVTHREAELREPTAADFLAATEDGEKVVQVKRGGVEEVELVASPTLVAVHLLRRQVVRIGDHEGPLTLAEIKRLSVPDLNALQQASEALQGAALKPLGKPSAAGGETPK